MSLLEHQLATKLLFKRNQKFWSAQDERRERKAQHRRRNPFTKSPEKFNKSLISSEVKTEVQVNKDMQKTKSKMEMVRNHNRRPSLFELSPPRQYFQACSARGVVQDDQRNYSNFKINAPDLEHTTDIRKLSPRNIDFTSKQISDLNYKPDYDTNKYSRSTMNCQFKYAVQNSSSGRYFFEAKKPQQFSLHESNPQNLLHSFSLCTPFKPPMKTEFFRMSARDHGGSLYMRGANNLTRSITKEPYDFTADHLKYLSTGANRNAPKIPIDNPACDLIRFRRLTAVEAKMNRSQSRA